MSAGGVRRDVERNAGSMSGKLASTRQMMIYDNCCGIHGAARDRRGMKRGKSAARRRNDLAVIREAVAERCAS